MNKQFEKGQLVAYCPEDENGNIYKVEIGIFNKLNKSGTGAFIWYHMGSTSACSQLEYLYPIANDSYIVIGHTFNSLEKEKEL